MERKGEERCIGLARSLAIGERKMMLLKKYEQSGKATEFSDERIEEWDEELGNLTRLVYVRSANGRE